MATYADDQLALPAPDGHHGIDRFQTGLHRLVHGLALDDAGGDLFDGRGLLRFDWPFAIDGVTQRIDHAAQQGLTYGHTESRSRFSAIP